VEFQKKKKKINMVHTIWAILFIIK